MLLEWRARQDSKTDALSAELRARVYSGVDVASTESQGQRALH